MTTGIGPVWPALLLAPFLAGAPAGAAQGPSASAGELLRTRAERAAPEPRRFYRARGYRPAWIGSPAADRRAQELRETLAAATVDGLDPRDYPLPAVPGGTARAADSVGYELALSRTALRLAHDLSEGRVNPSQADSVWSRTPHGRDLAAALATTIDSIGPGAALAALAPPHPGYAALRATLARYRLLAARGGWPGVPSGPELTLGDSGALVAILRRRLAIEAGTTDVADGKFDAVLDSAVRRFQRSHDLVGDGVVGPATRTALNVPASTRVRQLELNLERWRWLPRSLGERHVMVNIASSELRLVNSGVSTLVSRVIIGRLTWPTPIVSSEIFAVEFAPTWTIPHSIVKREVLPLVRRDTSYLRRERIHVFADSIGGRELLPSEVDWESVASGLTPVVLRQEPGNGNPLGVVKFLLRSRFGVYLHDTPDPARFAASRRSISHGCVRVERARELAECVLDAAIWPADSLLAAMARSTPRRVPLANPVPVHLCYWTAWVGEDGTPAFGRDVYGWDRRLDSVLVSRRRPSMESH